MTTPLDPVRSHVWDGSALPDWLQLDDYHFDNDQLVVRTPDGDTRPRLGWLLVQWSDGAVTVCSPTVAHRVYGPHGLAGRAARAEAALAEPGPATAATGHVYLSTGCWHGDHAYCQSMTGLNGAKRPASCKFCQASCRCGCHGETAQPGPA